MIVSFDGDSPVVDPTAFVAPNATLIGRVALAADVSIWYNCVLRADVERIVIGARSNIQDGTIIHCDSAKEDRPGRPTLIGEDVLVGHMVLLHGCILHDHAFVGLGSIVMDDCQIEPYGMLAAGALLTPGKVIQSRQLWAGRPARHIRDLTDEEVEAHRGGVGGYIDLARKHRAALQG
jgi:carbonic anhydrase/acetyltransferase-like protein (isoleucine patch superfamily)